MFCVYETTNLKNGKKYIGKSTVDKVDNKGYLGSGKALLNSIKHYGKENFVCRILIEFFEEAKAYSFERYWINKHDAVNSDMYYNLMDGGEGFTGPVSEEVLKKISKSKKGKITWNKGKTGIYSKETLQKMSEKATGRPCLHKGRTDFHSEESKQKMSENRKGTSAWNKGLSFLFGSKNPRYKNTVHKFYNKETEESFSGTQYNFYTTYGFSCNTISALVLGKRKSHKNWIYLGPEETQPLEGV